MGWILNDFFRCVTGADSDGPNQEEYKKTVIARLNDLHKMLTYEGIEEPEYCSIIEEHWDFQMCIQSDDIIRLYYDANGVLRKSFHVHPDMETFGPTWIPQDHCLLDVVLYNDRGESIRRCCYTNSRWPNSRFSGEPYLEIIRGQIQDGVFHWEPFHISKDNLFSQSAVSEPAKVDVEGRIPARSLTYGYDEYHTMDAYCDPERDDRDCGHWYRAIRCAPPYCYKTWVPLNLEEYRMEYRRRGDTVVIEGEGTLENKFFAGDTSIRKLVFGPNCDKIDSRAFAGCCNLETVEFMPGRLQSIGEEAFADCSNLKGIILPDTLEKIGDKAFSTCCALVSVSIPESVTEIGREAFEYCVELENLVIPDSVTEIGWDAFLAVPGIRYNGPARSDDNWGAMSRN